MRLPATLQGADRYLLVGLFNTVFDFTLFSFLALGARLDPVVANVISTAVVMTVSYAINRRWVFQSDSRGLRTYVGFATITGFSAFVVQSLVIRGVLEAAAQWAPHLSLNLVTPAAKVVAMAVGMTLNFFGYRWLFARVGARQA